MSTGALFAFDYALTDRFSFTVGLPYLGSKYTGPEPSLFLLPIDECYCWNHGWQDLGATLRYNLANGAFAVTPSRIGRRARATTTTISARPCSGGI